MDEFDRFTEERRARVAYNLARGRGFNGEWLPQTEEGIAQHQAAVAEYDRLFETSSGDQYQGRYDAIRLGLQYERDNESRDELMQREERERQAAAQRNRQDQMASADAQREARQAGEAAAQEVKDRRRERYQLARAVKSYLWLVDEEIPRCEKLVQMSLGETATRWKAKFERELDEAKTNCAKLLADTPGLLAFARDREAARALVAQLARHDAGDKKAFDDPDSGAAQAVSTEPKQDVFRQPVPTMPEKQVTNYMQWEEQGGGKFLNTRENIPEGIKRLVLIQDSDPDKFRLRAFTGWETDWQTAFPGVAWDPNGGQSRDGHRWDAHISREQYETIKAKGRLQP